jgi:hypothetical protein
LPNGIASQGRDGFPRCRVIIARVQSFGQEQRKDNRQEGESGRNQKVFLHGTFAELVILPRQS